MNNCVLYAKVKITDYGSRRRVTQKPAIVTVAAIEICLKFFVTCHKKMRLMLYRSTDRNFGNSQDVFKVYFGTFYLAEHIQLYLQF